jgi:tRNA U34 2-thiouridine synthase MnmA/TrmU
LTWVDQPLAPRARAVAQVSAHGRPARCAVDFEGAGLVVRFDVPQRPVAPGQTVALYDVDEPDAVVGAGITG